ncbi:type I secretion system permease/ATPase [Pseudoblastomonas flavescens]|uniref:type I secretion system permease/ATPase n=1 Tax=Alteriqipengyuania flavescens TaxID=3053610 RepID=UPI00299F8CCD|nr:type I secretion system permease/ATPase [Alteriqipengyuania flavescens]
MGAGADGLDGMIEDDGRISPSEREPRFADWLVEPLRANAGTYRRVALAAVFVNLFALVASIFTMVVYDRVIPNNATESLIALSIGLGIVVVFDFVLKMLRSYLTDHAGARIDLDVGRKVFQQLLAIRLDRRQGSTGALAGLMRELEALRDFFASATVLAMVDVPFILLILVVVALIGGPVVFVPMVLIPLVLLAGWLTNPALDRLSARALGQGLHKQSVLVETIGGLETVKAAAAGPMLAARWDDAVVEHAQTSLAQRLTANIALTFAQSAQMIGYAGVIIVGVGQIAAQEMSLGALIACSILSGRAVAPLTQIASILSRLNSTRSAYRQIDSLMQTERETGAGSALKLSGLKGEIEFADVTFAYPGTKTKALDNVSFRIAPGERVALVGRVGSGKSTIARLIMGLFPPLEGNVLVDNVDLRQLSKDDIRARIGAALQESVLFSGTVRDNITLGRADISDEEMLRAATLSKTHDFMKRIPDGYDRKLMDRGEGLSGGQRQSIALARALAGSPQVLLFDEPSSQMDNETENAVLEALESEVEGKTLVVITHRTPFLRLVDRVIVMDGGRVIADGNRDEVLPNFGKAARQPLSKLPKEALVATGGKK